MDLKSYRMNFVVDMEGISAGSLCPDIRYLEIHYLDDYIRAQRAADIAAVVAVNVVLAVVVLVVVVVVDIEQGSDDWDSCFVVAGRSCPILIKMTMLLRREGEEEG